MAWAALAGSITLNLVLIWAVFAAAVRRIHDLSLSGWCILAGFIALALLPKIDAPGPFTSLGQMLWFVAMAVVSGTRGFNVFGPDLAASPAPSTLLDDGRATGRAVGLEDRTK